MRTGIYVVLVAALVAPSAAFSQASGGHTQPFAVTGLGQSSGATDLSQDAAWKVTAYQRQGIRYLQVEDLLGKPRAAIAYIGDTIWTLPVGTDVDRVSTPDTPVSIPADATRRVVYTAGDIELVVHQSNGAAYWEFRKP